MTRIRKIFLGFTTACLLLLPACNEQAFDYDGDKVDASALTLSLSIEGIDTESATRVAVNAEAGETNVNTLTLFFFEPSSDKSGVLVDWIVLSNPSLDVNNPIPTDGKAISASNAYRVIGVANAGNYLAANWEEGWVGKSEADFRNGAIVELSGTFLTNGISSNLLLMNGSAVKSAGNGLIEIKLTRNVARFDVVNSTSDHTLVSAQVRNIYKKSSITGDGAWDNSLARSGITTATAPTGDGKSIVGKLYGFENRSTAPEQGDKITTCLIVGLKNGSNTKYYRINIHPEEEGQYLRRNNVYSVNIKNVIGSGYGSADDAYNGTEEGELNYTINNWDLGDNGLIVSDSYSILAVPVKLVQIGKNGATLSYTITTFSTLESPSPLQVKSKAGDNQLTVSLVGNTLTVTAPPLDNDAQIREGSVTLTYAGLEATMDIVQSLKADAFLKLSYETNWSGLFSSAGGDVSKLVYVNASGPWKATLIGDDGFSFDKNNYETEIIADNTGNNNFSIASISSNPSKTTRRNAFVIVTLDADPLNCVGVVSLSQSVASNINISPLVETVTFNGSRSVTTQGSESNVHKFTVSSFNEEGSPVTLNEEIIQAGDYRKFDCSLFDDVLTIWTTGANTGLSNYTAKLRIYGGGSELIITLIQRPLSLSVNVTQPTTVGPEGGETGSFYLNIDDEDATCSVSFTTRGVERDIFNHLVKLVYVTGDKIGEEVSSSDEFTANTKLKLVFPKIYFPNRETNIQTIVTFETNAGAKATYTFNQNKLTSKGVNIWNLRGNQYGSLDGSHFINAYRDAIRAFSGTFTNNTANTPPNNYPSNTTYIHLGNQFPSAFNWIAVKSFMEKVDGITVLTNDDGGTSLSKGNELLIDLKYRAFNPGGTPNISVASDITSSRVGLFLTTYGKTKLSNLSSIPGFYRNSILTYLSVQSSEGLRTGQGVALLTNPSNPDQVYLMIDPAQKFVFMGEIEAFDHDTYLTNGRKDFMNNFVLYVANAARYGSHFTDMLREDGEFINIKPMWDTVWGANKWPERSN